VGLILIFNLTYNFNHVCKISVTRVDAYAAHVEYSELSKTANS